MKKTIILCGLNASLLSLAVQKAVADFSDQGFPLEIVVVNNTPLNFQIPQAGAEITSNLGELNATNLTIQTEDQLKRVLSDFEQLLALNQYESALEIYLKEEFARYSIPESESGLDLKVGDTQINEVANGQAISDPDGAAGEGTSGNDASGEGISEAKSEGASGEGISEAQSEGAEEGSPEGSVGSENKSTKASSKKK
ncbi:hypothetical protein [Undibacterium crateris]|uniref:hypothetical protein n=1 Tax=Undibacterium crateris TaxID=2528175 RepID=UPI0013895E42|nr:hypothetical protein [Undibacterium crateris]NDI85055.1 hypothetical protein [Undibacterium crateris]